MKSSATKSTQNSIHWPQILALLGLSISIQISWIAYHNYDEVVLKAFNFTQYTFFLITAKAVILFLMPPISGILADRFRRKDPRATPVFTVGISVTAMIFFSVATSVSGALPPSIHILVPVLIVLWIVSMNIFNSPALSTVEMFAPKAQLPFILAIFAVVSDVLAAFEPVINDIINYFGGPATFTAGGVLILGSGLILRNQIQKLSIDDLNHSSEDDTKTSNYMLAFLPGFGAGIILAAIMKLIPVWIDGYFPPTPDAWMSGKHIVSGVLLAAALFSIPFGKYAEKQDVGKLLLYSLIAAGILVLMIYLIKVSLVFTIVLCLPLAAAFSLAFVSAFPFALSNMNTTQKVLGTGLFFSGMELTSSVLDVISLL